MIQVALTVAAVLFLAWVLYYLLGCVLVFIMIVRHNHLMKHDSLYKAQYTLRCFAAKYGSKH
jgi:hypothetical protein